MKSSKIILKELVKFLTTTTGKKQWEISKGAGYEKETVTQMLSKPTGHEPVIDQLKLVYKETLKNSIYDEDKDKTDEGYLAQRRNKKNNETKPGIPIYESAPSTLSTTELYRDEKQVIPDFWITIPFLRDCDYGTRAKGESMHPLIRTNALVIGKRIYDISVIIFGEIYTVITNNGIETTKYIYEHPDNPEMILLVPYNSSSKTTPIRKSDILKLYEAKAVFNNL